MVGAQIGLKIGCVLPEIMPCTGGVRHAFGAKTASKACGELADSKKVVLQNVPFRLRPSRL
jgi:hypothetical protein